MLSMTSSNFSQLLSYSCTPETKTCRATCGGEQENASGIIYCNFWELREEGSRNFSRAFDGGYRSASVGVSGGERCCPATGHIDRTHYSSAAGDPTRSAVGRFVCQPLARQGLQGPLRRQRR
jgi:hypothetical protein